MSAEGSGLLANSMEAITRASDELDAARAYVGLDIAPRTPAASTARTSIVGDIAKARRRIGTIRRGLADALETESAGPYVPTGGPRQPLWRMAEVIYPTDMFLHCMEAIVRAQHELDGARAYLTVGISTATPAAAEALSVVSRELDEAIRLAEAVRRDLNEALQAEASAPCGER